MQSRANPIRLTLLCLGLPAALQAAPLDLSSANYVVYGNAQVYSMPINAAIYTANGGAKPNPYSIGSTPGAIKDQLVIYTGAGGVDVNTNAAGFDNAYGAPGPNVGFSSIHGAVNVGDPGNKAGIANNNANTWDANLLSLKGFLNGGDAIFMFNNNDTNKDQNLAAWSKIWITDAGGGVYGNRYLYVSNEGQVYGYAGEFLGNANDYNPGNVGPGINAGSGATDYVLAGGGVCVHQVSFLPVACNDPDAKTYNHNLGADRVAYAVTLPLLDGFLQQLFLLGDNALDDYTLHVDVRLGCDAGWNGNCTNKGIDNGYEQLFLVSGAAPPPSVPEPSVYGLLGLAALMAFARRRRPR